MASTASLEEREGGKIEEREEREGRGERGRDEEKEGEGMTKKGENRGREVRGEERAERSWDDSHQNCHNTDIFLPYFDICGS